MNKYSQAIKYSNVIYTFTVNEKKKKTVLFILLKKFL